MYRAEGWVRALWVRGCPGLGREKLSPTLVTRPNISSPRSRHRVQCGAVALSWMNSGVSSSPSQLGRGSQSHGGGVLCRKHFPEHQRGARLFVSLCPGALPELLFKTNDVYGSLSERVVGLGMKQGLRTVCWGRRLALLLRRQPESLLGGRVRVSGVVRRGRPGVKKCICARRLDGQEAGRGKPPGVQPCSAGPRGLGPEWVTRVSSPSSAHQGSGVGAQVPGCACPRLPAGQAVPAPGCLSAGPAGVDRKPSAPAPPRAEPQVGAWQVSQCVGDGRDLAEPGTAPGSVLGTARHRNPVAETL